MDRSISAWLCLEAFFPLRRAVVLLVQVMAARFSTDVTKEPARLTVAVEATNFIVRLQNLVRLQTCS